MHVERLSYQGLPNCYRLSNGVIDLIITGDVGLRVIRFGFAGEQNEFFEARPLTLPPDRSTWQVYGGHRLWHAPEQVGRTTLPDNQPVTIEDHGDFVRVIQPLEAPTGIVKSIDISLAAESPSVRLVHRFQNHGLWDVKLALWALSVMSHGGTAIIPLPPRGTHPEELLPKSTLALWAYTDLSDPRWRFGQKYIFLRQDRNFALPQKIGASVPSGWVAYANNDHVFIKLFDYTQGAEYPDLGSSVEVFTNADMLEVETLSPVLSIAPQASAEHVERWTLARGIPETQSDRDVDRLILPLTQPKNHS